ncbi:hypothetical protein AMJ85_07675, partial [candidate division BRC1 bacterium SM23_51]
MANKQHLPETTAPVIPLSVLALWIVGGISFGLIVYLFTPYTHNLDDIKVTLQYVLAPIVWGLFAVALWFGHIRRIHPAIVLPLFAFMLIMLAAAIVGMFPWRAWRDIVFQLTIMAPFLVVAGTCTNERRFRNICLYYFLIGCGTVFLGLFHFWGGVGLIFQRVYPLGQPEVANDALFTLLNTLSQNSDMLSTILNRDFYPAYLLMIIPLSVAMALDYRDWRAKVFFLLMFFLMCMCIVVAFSKDTYTALLFMFVLFAVLYAGPRGWRTAPRQVLWVWAVAGLIIFASLLFGVRTRFYNLGWSISVSVISRKIIWGGAFGILFDTTRSLGASIKHVLLGGGPGSYYLAFPIYRDPDYHLYEISNVTLFAHNQYLDLLCEEGVLGFVAFMVFLGALGWFLLREARRKFHHPLNVYQIALFTALVGISFQNTFSPNIRWTVCGFNYWFLLGLVVAACHLTLSENELRRIDEFFRFPPALRKGIAVAFLVFALLFEAIAIPYGLIRFNAAKNNNDGLILLNGFGDLHDLLSERVVQLRNQMGDPKYGLDAQFRERTEQLREGTEQLRETTRQKGIEAIEKFRRAVTWYPAFVTSYYKLAHLYSRMASPLLGTSTEQAIEWWKKGEATYDTLAVYAPDYSEIHLNYGILGRVFYGATNEVESLVTALLKFQKAARMSNKIPVQNYYYETLEKAVPLATTSSPIQAETVAVLEQGLRDLNPPGTSEESFERRLGELRDLINAGETQKAGRLEAELFHEMAIRVAERIPTLENRSGLEGAAIITTARWAVANYYIRKERYGEALPILEVLLDEDPQNTAYLRTWTTAALNAGEPRRHLELCARLIKRNPVDWAVRDA